MEDGLFTLIFIALFIVMSVLDAVGRRRKRQRQMEDLEEAGGGAEAEEVGTAVEDHRTWGSGAAEAESPWQAGPETPSGAEGERETADQMVPEDFWAILTGQAPADRPEPTESQSRGEPGAAAGESPKVGAGASAESGRVGTRAGAYRPPGDIDALGRRGDPEPPEEPHIPAPLPGDRLGSSGSSPGPSADPAPTRRSARWMEGVGGREERDTTFGPGRGGEFDAADPMAEPWDDIADIAEGDLTSGSGELEVTSVEDGAIGGRRHAAHRRGRGRGAYTRLLETGDREDLRKAIVLREVLGPPVGFRD
jgi:hypothetical protein